MRLDTFQAALTNPSTIHKSSSLTEAFNEFLEGIKHFLKTGEVKNVRAQEREAQFIHILDEIKYNLNTEKIGLNETQILYTNKKNGMQIEQRGLNIISVSLDADGKEQTLETFSSVDELQGFINGYPLISAATGNHDFHKFLLSIRYKGQAFLPNVKKIAEAHFDNVPDEDLRLDVERGEQRDECDVSNYIPTLTHLLRSQPLLLAELQAKHLTGSDEDLNVLEAAYPEVTSGIGFVMLAMAMSAAQQADAENKENLPLITRQPPPPTPLTSADAHPQTRH